MAIVFGFYAVIFVMLVLRIVIPTPLVSVTENRKLKEFPELSLESVFFGKFTQEFDDYFADTFPFRDPLIQADDYVSYIHKIPIAGVDTFVVMDENEMPEDDVFGESDTNSVSFSDDEDSGDLNEQMSSNTSDFDFDAAAQPDEDYESQIPELPEEDMEAKGRYLMTDTAIYQEVTLAPKTYTAWAEGLNRLQEALPDQRILVMSPPTSYSFYAQEKYYSPETDQKQGTADFFSLLDDRLIAVDVIPILERHRDEYIYFRTDHHWAARGGYWSYVEFCKSLSIQPINIEDMQYNIYDKDFLGAYYKTLKETAKAKIVKRTPDFIEYFVPPYDVTVMMYGNTSMSKGREVPLYDLDVSKITSNYYRVYLGGDYPCLKLTSAVGNGKSILVLKDSYGNAFIPFLTASYETVYVADFRDYNSGSKPKLKLEELIARIQVDDVLCLMGFKNANRSVRVNGYLRALP